MTGTSEPNSSVQTGQWPMIAREGWPVIAGFLLFTLALWTAAWWAFGWPGHLGGAVGLIFSLWAIWFFRDPERSIPAERGTVVSPADGVVCFVGPGAPPEELGIAGDAATGMTRVSVFMNVFNVHVNRAPMGGRVVRVAYRPGKFFNASFDKASIHNERLSLALELPDGRPMVVVQVAGLIARRIVCRVTEGARLLTGERFGMIRFGSRVDTYLPAGVAAGVKVGDVAVAGETVLARITEPAAGVEAAVEPKGGEVRAERQVHGGAEVN